MKKCVNGCESMSRRSFVRDGFAAAMAFPAIVPRHVLGGSGYTAPSGRVTLGCVGIGGIGHDQIPRLANAGFQVVALCDVDDVYAKRTYDKFPQACRYRDFREMLAKEGDSIDAVYCGAPDHTHAFVTLAALRAKKHVCCVKPLTRSMEECYLVVEEAKKAGVATQVTATPCTSEYACRVCEIIASGILGDIVEAHAWTNRPVWPQGMPAYPSFTSQVPSTFDWNLWIGSAEMRPFADKWPEDNPLPRMCCTSAYERARAVYHPFNHRGWYDFGAGALGDMGCHQANTFYRALELGHPSRISSTSSRTSDVAFPLASIVTYDYPKRGTFPELRLVWYDGLLKPPAPKELKGRGLPKEGVLYVGTKATMLVGGLVEGIRILDPALHAKAKTIPATLPRRGDIWREWLVACQGGEKAGCNFDWAALITEFVLLGNLSVRTGRAVEFDPATLHVTNNRDADALLRLKYHNGWELRM